MTKKIFAMFLAVLMVVSLLPTSVFAATCPGKDSNNHTVENCEWEVVKVTEPTCGFVGYTSYKCKTCGVVFVDSQVAATGEHNWVANDKDVAPTCGTAGSTGGQKCSVCGEVKNATVVPPVYKPGTACEWVDKTPTIDCTTGGEKVWECAACGAKKTEKVAKKAEHNWYKNGELNVKLVTPATAEANGLATVTCVDCGKVKEVVVFYDHDCVLVTVEGYAATCTTAGLEEHMECRYCGIKYNADGTKALTEKQIAALVKPAAHTFECPETCKVHANGKHVATCVDTVLHCAVCDKYLDVRGTVEHSYNDKNWKVEKEATCTQTGFATNTCEKCGYATTTRIEEALGHYSVTVTVPATCGSYGYTFTYCTRKDCKDGVEVKEEVDVTVSATKRVTSVSALNKGFYLEMNQTKLGTKLYFAGTTNDKDYQLATTHNIAEATKVYVEIVHPELDNAYYLYFFNAEGVKTYIEIYQYETDTYVSGSLKLTTEKPATYFKWVNVYTYMDKEVEKTVAVDNFVTSIYNEKNKTTYDYYLASKDSRDYISVFEARYAADRFGATPVVKDGKAAVNVLSYEVFKKAGFNATAHVLSEAEIIAATCTTAGLNLVTCEHCAYTAEVEVPATHDFVKLTGKITVDNKEIDAFVAVSCVEGYQYYKCACGEMKKEVYPAYGHKMGETVKFVPTHTATAGYDYIPCVYCDYTVKTTLRTWTDAQKHWDSYEAASKGHGNAVLSYVGVAQTGSCTAYGLDKYVCAGCGKNVLVKNSDQYGKTGEHVMSAADKALVVEATCTTKGGVPTYECVRCKAIVGNAAKGELNETPALGHDWKENKDYKAAKCESPVLGAYTHTCKRCDEKKLDGTEIIKTVVATNECTEYSYVYYNCHCGQEHMRSFITKLGHSYIVIDANKDGKETVEVDGQTIPAYVAPTCYSTGYYYQSCEFCGDLKKVELNTVEHENAAKEKFTDKCTDTVTDRHCVVCHKAAAIHATTGNAHDCSADLNKDKKADCLNICIIDKVCHPVVNTVLPSTCTTDAHSLVICGDCGKETVKFSNLGWNGHKPAEADKDANGEYIKYANYVYVEYTWTSVNVVDGAFEANTEKYLAKFAEYVPASYAADGFWKGYCVECKQDVTQVMPKLEGLGFELTAPEADFTFGSLVEIIVSVNGADTDVYGFNFAVSNEDMTFVGYELLNENFVLTVTDPTKADEYVLIAGFAANNASGKMQNISINGKTELVKLYYRVTEYVTAETEMVVNFVGANATVVEDGKAVAVATAPKTEPAIVTVRQFIDFNNDGVAHITDLYLAMSMITGEHADGKTYDVTVDMNKDGVVDLEDLSIAYNYAVGNYDLVDLFKMGISDAELEILGFGATKTCNNSACNTVLPEDAVYCHVCGNHQ